MENKNLSEGLQELIYKANTFAETAAQIIIEAYRYAVDVDHLKPLEAAKVLNENLVYSPQWIRKQLPDEAKHIQMRRLPSKIAKGVSQISQETKEYNVNIPQSAPNIVDVEPIIQQPQERRTPESPDNSMVQQLNHINIQLKKKIEDLEKLMEIRMADKDQRIEQFTILNIGMKKDVERLMDENMKLKSEKQKLETELTKYKRMEELRLAVQRRDIKEWRNPGDKP